MMQQGGFGGGFEGFNFGGFDFQGDIFDEFFRGGSNRRQSATRVEGRNIQKKIKITLEEAFSGKEVELELDREERCDTCNGNGVKEGPKHKCQHCKGTGYISINAIFTMIRQTCPECHGSKYTSQSICNGCNGNRLKKVKRKTRVGVPPGIEDGQSLRLGGLGGAGIDAPNGDLILTVEVLQHSIFRRDKADLYRSQYVLLTDLVLGGTTEVTGLTGERVLVRIPPHSQVNSRIRVANQGMRMGSSSRGVLYVDLIPRIPDLKIAPDELKAAWEIIQRHENMSKFKLNSDQSQSDHEQGPDIKKN